MLINFAHLISDINKMFNAFPNNQIQLTLEKDKTNVKKQMYHLMKNTIII